MSSSTSRPRGGSADTAAKKVNIKAPLAFSWEPKTGASAHAVKWLAEFRLSQTRQDS